MLNKKYTYMFPHTFAAKHVVAPYNRRASNRARAAEARDKKLSSVQIQTSDATLDLSKLADFSWNNPDLQTLLIEGAQILRVTLKASFSSVYIVNPILNELQLLTGQQWVIVPEEYRFEIEGFTSISAYVALSKEYEMVENIQEDLRFPMGTGNKYDQAKSVLCVPVVTPNGECFAVLEFVKTEEDPFTKDDLKIGIVVTGWMGAAIHQNLQRITMQKQETLHDYLLTVTQSFFNEHITCNEMVSALVNYSKESLNVIRGAFYIIDKDCDELVADIYEEGIDMYQSQLIKKKLSVKPLQRDLGVATLVARTGQTVNIKDSARDPRIGKEPELVTGKSIKTMLCMPIQGAGGLVGIIKLLNKRTGVFSRADELTLKIFTTYASCCLQFNTLSNRLKKQNILRKIYMGILNAQLKPCVHEYEYCLKLAKMPTKLTDFRWYISDTMLYDAPQIAVHMVKDLCPAGEVLPDNILKFMLITRRLYRNNAYHNFEHAFNFLQCMYAILKRNDSMFTPMETKALLIASICHDIDHGGLTNNFLMITNHVLYKLYSESPWENYHYMITAHLLERVPIFKSFGARHYKVFLREIKEAILATDLQSHFKNRRALLSIVNEEKFEISNSHHKYLLKTILMTVCDLSGQCKPYAISRKITENVYKEFYSQGDREKKLGLPPLSMMDREKQHLIPEDQIQFLTVIVLPATEILRGLLPNTVDLNNECLAVRKSWQEIHENNQKKIKNGDKEMDDGYDL